MRKVLVLRGGALGDFIVTLPLLGRLRAAWPQSRVELIGNQEAAALGVEAGVLAAAHSQHEARWSALFAEGGEDPGSVVANPAGSANRQSRRSGPTLPDSLRNWLEEFDLVLNFWPDRDGALRRNFPVRAGQIYRSREAAPGLAPASAHYLEMVDEFGAPSVDNFFSLERTCSDSRGIALHCGSGSPRKNWPVERWREIAEFLRATYSSRLLIISGPAELERSLDEYGEALHSLPLRDLRARLKSCRFFVGHDSGISHLAAACGVPSLLLFGPTSPEMWAPPAPHVKVLRNGECLDLISVAEVQAAISRALPEK